MKLESLHWVQHLLCTLTVENWIAKLVILLLSFLDRLRPIVTSLVALGEWLFDLRSVGALLDVIETSS